tara:strand:- start:166 stop:951 length:786 start_codon:yes stop_codon:yes gene_type:complete
MTKKWSSFKEQQLLTENFRNWLSEDDKQLDELNLFLEQRAVEKLRKINEPQMLKEMDIDIGSGAIRIKTEFMKWATISGVSYATISAGLTIAMASLGWEGVAIVFITTASSPVIMAIGGLAFLTAYMKSPFIRKIVNWIFKKIAPDVTSKIAAGVEALIDKIVEASDGALSKEKAIEFYGMIVEHIIKDKEFRDKLKSLAWAFVKRNHERITAVSEELDDIVKRLIKDIQDDGEGEEEVIDVEEFEEKPPDTEEELPLAAQ